MNQHFNITDLTPRNGTSQTERQLSALDPNYVSVDERTLIDLIHFARNYASQLLYIDADTQRRGNWESFLQGDPEEMLAYFKDPGIFDHDPEKKAQYSRPHLILFLTFLELLQPIRAEMNKLTARHLNFFYEEALRLTRKKAQLDQVHLIVEPLSQEPNLFIPQGTRFLAGTDSEGKDLHYQTKTDLLANQIKVSSLISLQVRLQRTTLEQIKAQSRNIETDLGFMDMLRLVYGDEGLQSKQLPLFRDSQRQDQVREMDSFLIDGLDKLLGYIRNTLSMRFSSFQRIVKLYESWSQKRDWDIINEILISAHQNRLKGSKKLEFVDFRNFDENFTTSIGFHPSQNSSPYDGLVEVDSLYDLFRVLVRLKPQESNTDDPDPQKQARINQLEDFITGRARNDQGQAIGLFFPSSSRFREFMKIRENGLNKLREILNLLRDVVRDNSVLSFSETINEFSYFPGEHLLEAYLNRIQRADTNGVISPVAPFSFEAFSTINISWTQYYDEILSETGRYFRMSLPDYYFIREVFNQEKLDQTQPDWKWERVFNLFRTAFSPSMLSEPVDVRWKNLYLAEDATALEIPPQSAKGLARWKTFGQVAEHEGLKRGRLGFAIASPILNLEGGRRTITLTLGFASFGFAENLDQLKAGLEQELDPNRVPLQFLISTAEEMLALKPVKLVCGKADLATFPHERPYENAIQVELEISPELPPISPLQTPDSISKWPVLQAILTDLAQEGTDDLDKQYELFQKLQLIDVHLAVDVREVKNIKLQHDEGEPDVKKPFEAFGSDPGVGNSLYLTHPELARKRLDSLSIEFDWMNLPENGLGEHYKTYRELAETKDSSNQPLFPFTIPIKDNDDFKVKVYFRDGHLNYDLSLDGALSLFPGEDANPKSKKLIQLEPTKALEDKLKYQRKPEMSEQDSVLEYERYFQLELMHPGFQQDIYPILQSAKPSIEEHKNKILFPPYLPVLKQIQFAYRAHTEYKLSEGRASDQDQLFHLLPTGYNLLELEDNIGEIPRQDEDRSDSDPEPGYYLIPRFDYQGALYIGLEGLNPPQSLSLLFQLAEGSNNPRLKASKVDWHYLSGTGWKSLEDGQLHADETRGLLTSGIIHFNIPADTSVDHSILPKGVHWLRAKVDQNPDSINDTIGIHSQAIKAVFIDQENSLEHYKQPLPAESIEQTVDPIPGLASVLQPYPAFGGKAPEESNFFYTRLSERLRHKQRALTMWDYERLVLEQFPEIHRVKALHADWQENPNDIGAVQLILLPSIRGKQLFDPFEPRVSQDLLQKVLAFIQPLAPSFVKVRVANPDFYYLVVKVEVRFHDNSNPGYYLDLLNRELREYLSPWMADDASDIVFGGEIYESVIVNFIENRSYVDFIAYPDLIVQQLDANRQAQTLSAPHIRLGPEGHLIINRQDVVLVSHPQHRLTLIPDFEDEGSGDRVSRGVGAMEVELDFQINAS